MIRTSGKWLLAVWFGIGVILVTTGCSPFADSSDASPTPNATAIEVSPTYLEVSVTPSSTPTLTPTPSQTPTRTPIVPRLVLDDALSEAVYRMPLTIQHITEDSVVLLFELEGEHDAQIFIWPVGSSPDQANSVQFPSPEGPHLVTFAGLKPGTEYRAAVGIQTDPESFLPPTFIDGPWDPVQFRTLNEDLTRIRGVVIGDSGFADTVTFNLAKEMADVDPDFVIHTGDMVYSANRNRDAVDAFIRKYYEPLKPLLTQAPLYPVIGNHDIYRDAWYKGEPYYYHIFPPINLEDSMASGSEERREWYAFELGGIQFVMLNSQRIFNAESKAEQNAWLAERLNDQSFTATIVVFHVPPYTSGLHTEEGAAVRSSWKKILDQGNVALVLSGHDHNYERLEADGTTYIVSGGGSATLYSMKSRLTQSQIFVRQTHFVMLDIYQDHIEIFAIALGGKLLDHTSLEFGSQ